MNKKYTRYSIIIDYILVNLNCSFIYVHQLIEDNSQSKNDAYKMPQISKHFNI